jgi:hypothetical protein
LMHRSRRTLAAVFFVSLVAATTQAAAAQNPDGNDLRDIQLGRPIADLPDTGYANRICADNAKAALATWSSWRDCPADSSGFHAIRFGYDPATNPDGTIVAGHPVILTLLIDDAGVVNGLRIETDPKARLYIRKKAFLFGIQVKSRYGLDGWSCTQAQPNAGEQPVGGVYLRERCTKVTDGRSILVERSLFRRSDQDSKNFVDETRMTILRAGG